MSEIENLGTNVEEAEHLGEEIAEAYDKGLTERLKKANVSVIKTFDERYKACIYMLGVRI